MEYCIHFYKENIKHFLTAVSLHDPNVIIYIVKNGQKAFKDFVLQMFEKKLQDNNI